MTEAKQLLQAIKRQLKAQGIAYRDVAAALQLSEVSVKRIFSGERITLNRLEELCTLIGFTIAELSQEAASMLPKLEKLTAAQEKKLIEAPKFLLVAVCALNHWSVADITAHYAIDEVECLQLLLGLDRLGLIDLLPGNRIRLRVSRDFDWLPDGPIRHYFAKHGQSDFLNRRFDQNGESLLFVHGMLTPEASTQFQTQLRQLRKSFDNLHHESTYAPIGQRHGIGLLLAMREWEPPEFAALRK